MLKVLKQLLQELFLPLLVALIWTAYNIYELPRSQLDLKTIINLFGPTFFLSSWLISQVFRVRKQQKVDGGLFAIEKNVKKTLVDLEEKTSDLVGLISGGDSACYLYGAPITGNLFIPHLGHIGKYPIHDVHATVAQLEALKELKTNPPVANLLACYAGFPLGTVLPFQAVSSGITFDLGTGERCSFNVFYAARNGSFTQYLRFRRVNGSWRYATKVMRGQTVIHENIHDSYPRDVNGQVEWECQNKCS